MSTYFQDRFSNTATMPMPTSTHPAPARKPAMAPKPSVVPGAFRNMARLNAITRLSTNAIENPFTPAGAGSTENPLARFHAVPSRAGEYHNPPITNADTDAVITAHTFKV